MGNEIAVRFYENKRFGSTYAKGAFHKAVFNATADVQQPKTKYLLDMIVYKDWVNTAKSDADMEILNVADELVKKYSQSDVLATFIKRMGCDGSKSRVNGFALLDLNTRELTLAIEDEEAGVKHVWQLEAKSCKQSLPNKNSPQMLATNVELT
jgi:hypothetical protein